ncbi:MAG: hypothetical protein RLZZ595_1983, partial [Bacteroidota bacterium]
EQLFGLYLKSVGRGAALDLGIAPTTSGLLADEDVEALKGFGVLVKETFKNNLLSTAKLTASNERGKSYSVANLVDENWKSYWATADEIQEANFTIEWKSPQAIDFIRLREYIPLGQRIEKVIVESFENGKWMEVANTTSVGACRIIALDKTLNAAKIRIRMVAPVCLTLSELGCYKKIKP